MNLKTLCLAGLAALTLAACGGNTNCADQAAATQAAAGTLRPPVMQQRIGTRRGLAGVGRDLP